MYIKYIIKNKKFPDFFLLRQFITLNISLFSIASFMDGVLLITQDQHWSRKIPVIHLKIRWFTQKITTQVKCFSLPVPNQNLKMTESLFQSHLMEKRSNPTWYSLMPKHFQWLTGLIYLTIFHGQHMVCTFQKLNGQSKKNHKFFHYEKS